MTEDFLHHIWKYRLLNNPNLKTQSGDTLEIISQGFHNTDAGPDFLNARLKINDTIWAGNIEIHTKSSDWYKHKHENNLQYDNIILHVVYEDDMQILRKNKEIIPTLCIKNSFDENLFLRYKELLANKQWIACEKNLRTIDKSILTIWKEKLLVDRLVRKSQEIEAVLKKNNNDWNQTFYERLFKNFGFKINSVAFEMLAKSLPEIYLCKHNNSIFQIEALLFGQAGFLNKTFKDPYPISLQKEYVFLKQKFSLNPINFALWHMLRIRPQNFPQMRLAQLATLLHNAPSLFSKIIEKESTECLSGVFMFECSPYWQTHYLFDKAVRTKNTIIGKLAIDNIIINTVVPFLFAYGTIKDEPVYKERALNFLEQTLPEKNHIINKWNERNVFSKTAKDTQALLELKNNFCQHKKCLSCMIGNTILKNN